YFRNRTPTPIALVDVIFEGIDQNETVDSAFDPDTQPAPLAAQPLASSSSSASTTTTTSSSSSSTFAPAPASTTPTPSFPPNSSASKQNATPPTGVVDHKPTALIIVSLISGVAMVIVCVLSIRSYLRRRIRIGEEQYHEELGETCPFFFGPDGTVCCYGLRGGYCGMAGAQPRSRPQDVDKWSDEYGTSGKKAGYLIQMKDVSQRTPDSSVQTQKSLLSTQQQSQRGVQPSPQAGMTLESPAPAYSSHPGSTMAISAGTTTTQGKSLTPVPSSNNHLSPPRIQDRSGSLQSSRLTPPLPSASFTTSASRPSPAGTSFDVSAYYSPADNPNAGSSTSAASPPASANSRLQFLARLFASRSKPTTPDPTTSNNTGGGVFGGLFTSRTAPTN
ncbi:hypothetical protein HK102_011210, partial [Quaeritorhiza haematococci]